MSSRFDRLEELKAEAAALLNLPVDADNVILLAALKLQHQAMVEGLVAGRSVDAAEMINVTEAISKFVPAAQNTVQLTIQPVTLCGRCREAFQPQPPPAAEARPSPPPSKPPANVVLLKQPQRSNNGAP